MLNLNRESRTLWLIVGVLAGLCLSYFWPHEQVAAGTVDRDPKFAMITVPIMLTNLPGADLDGVFVLDFLTGQLRGGVLNTRTNTFGSLYAHNLAADFQVDPTAEPHYAIVSGQANLSNRGPAQFATGVLYVGELRSGRVVAYGLVSGAANRPMLVPLDSFQFRVPIER